MSSSSKFKINQVIQQFLPALESQNLLSGHQRSILKLIRICKTSQLGGHREQCPDCRHSRIHYNSCGNRNCPSCQAVKKERWIFDRQQDLLPVKYFHCVFTIPSELYIYFLYNKKCLYNHMMRCVKETLMIFGKDPRQGINGKIGAISLLHTWTQQMTYHPHVHCIVPAGGLRDDKTWHPAKSNGHFLFPVKAMSALFRGKLLAAIHQLFKKGDLVLPKDELRKYPATKNLLYKKPWVVYAKKAFGSPDQVLEYLARYTHRICISNHRITNITNSVVTFKYLDRKVNKVKSKPISGDKFLRLFAQHILPRRFVKIRHFGFLASRNKAKDLALIRKSLKAKTPNQKIKMTTKEFVIKTTGKNPHLCPKCKQAEMVIIKVFKPIRGSPLNGFTRPLAKDRIINIV